MSAASGLEHLKPFLLGLAAISHGWDLKRPPCLV